MKGAVDRKVGRTGARGGFAAGFTLIEVLVVVAIIALLLSILLPSLSRARAQARRTQCGSNVHQQMLVLMAYAADYKGKLPPNVTGLRKSPPFYYVDTVVALPVAYDQRQIFRRYLNRQVNIFACPANGGPRMDDPNVTSYIASAIEMQGQYMHFYNSTCVFKGSSFETPWAPTTEWTAGGPTSSMPVLQDEYIAGNSGGTTPNDPGTKFSFNHGPGMSRSRYQKYTPFGNWLESTARRDCDGVNVGYLDGHAAWVKNVQLSATRWSLDMPWSKASTRPLSSPSEAPIAGGGAVMTVPGEIR